MNLAELLHELRTNPNLRPFVADNRVEPVAVTAAPLGPDGRVGAEVEVVGFYSIPGPRIEEGKEKGRLAGPGRLVFVYRQAEPVENPPPVPEVVAAAVSTDTEEPVLLTIAMMPPFDGTWPDPKRDPKVNLSHSKPAQGTKERAELDAREKEEEAKHG